VQLEYAAYTDDVPTPTEFMEGELKLVSKVAEAKLMSLDDHIFKLYFERIRSAHKQLWPTKNFKEQPSSINGGGKR
jgi:hypothetical protein